MIKLVPLGHRIVVKPIRIEKKTKSGLFIPDQSVDLARAGIDKGEIIAIGETAWQDERLGGKPWCKVGDNIIWARYAGKPVDIPDDSEEGYTTYHLLNDEDVLAKEVDT